MTDAAERCGECGFDSSRWRVRDAVDHFEALGWWWRSALAAVDAGVVEPPGDLGDLVDQAKAADGSPGTRIEGKLIRLVHETSHRQMEVARRLSAESLVPGPGGPGRVVQINTGDGGVPKTPVGQVVVTTDGLAGDRQADKKHHGRPFQAVCLWPTEAIDTLAAEDHPVSAGCVGENFTVEGLDWLALRAGTRLALGDTLIELSYPAVPCRKQAQWFTDGDFSRLAYEKHPEWVRWYGWVRRPGTVSTGDRVSAA